MGNNLEVVVHCALLNKPIRLGLLYFANVGQVVIIEKSETELTASVQRNKDKPVVFYVA